MPASVRDVAQLAGVSVGTVSNVLNSPDKVASKTVKQVQRAIAELGFVRNDAARQLRAGRSRSIGLVVLDVRNPFFTDLARGVEDTALEVGMNVLLANSDQNDLREKAMLSLFEEQRVQGVLVTPSSENLEVLKSLQGRGTPIVVVDRKTENGSFCSVSVDDVHGGYLAAKHLIDQGCKRITFVGGPETLRQVADRLSGARKAVSQAASCSLEVVTSDGLSVQEGRRVGDSLLSRDSSQKPDGVFAVNDLLAIGIVQACAVGGVAIPKEMKIIGYDDIGFAQTAIVPLSSIRQPVHEMGAMAVKLLLEQASANPQSAFRQVEFQPELVVRSSSLN